MDKKLTPSKRKPVFDTAWQNDAKNLVLLSKKFDRLKETSCYLPFGWVETEGALFIFTEFSDVNNLTLLLNKKDTLKTGFMQLLLDMSNGRPNLQLKQTFPASFEKQMISKKINFEYSWTKKEVTITRKLGTTSPGGLKKQIKVLLNECKRFLFMYCNTEIKLNQP